MLIGNLKLFQHEGLAVPSFIRDHIVRLEAEGKTVMIVARETDPVENGECRISRSQKLAGDRQIRRQTAGFDNPAGADCDLLRMENEDWDVGFGHWDFGMIALADTVRGQSRVSIAALREAGIQRMVMLTGDNEGTAWAIATQVGVDEFRADLLPEDKVDAIDALLAEYGRVAMVGDGVNDAPALARATVGIAMGAAGTDTALETADIALMADDLSRLPWAMKLSRRALGVVKQNIGLSLLIKAVFLALALSGYATLWMAVFADMGASLIVILNGMRLLRDGTLQRTGRI